MQLLGGRCHLVSNGCICSAILLVVSLSLFSSGQQAPANTLPFAIPSGTPVQLQTLRTISSVHAKKGDSLDFVVVKDVTVGGSTIIQAGTLVSGSVAAVKRKRPFGIGGDVVITSNSVELASGERVPLRARKEVKGKSQSKFMLAGLVASGLVYLPAAPLFLLTRGADGTVLKGTELTAYLDGGSTVSSQKSLAVDDDASELHEMLEFLPGRTLDGEGHEGDMLNLVLVGDSNDVQQVFARAGWVATDQSKLSVFCHLLQHGTHYAKLPMATLYVFGRRQTYSYAMPDPAAMIRRRHHLRIWQTDYTMDGVPIWVGAASHDVSIQVEMKKFRVTHRIDPDVDAERDFVGSNLADTQLLTQEKYVQPTDPVFSGQSATGSTYHSDSRILLLELSRGASEPGVAGEVSQPSKVSIARSPAIHDAR